MRQVDEEGKDNENKQEHVTILPKSGTGTWRMLGFMRDHYSIMGLAAGTGIVHRVLAIASAAMSAYLVGKVAFGANAGELVAPFWLLIGLVIGKAFMSWAEMYWVHDAAYAILSGLRNQVYEALERLAPGYLVRKRTGEIASAAMSDVETLEMFYAHTIGALLIAVIVPFGALAALFYIHWLFPLVLMPWLILLATVPFWLRKRAHKQGQEVRDKFGGLHAEVVDGVQGLREILAFGFEDRYLKKLRVQNDKLAEAELRYGKRSGMEGASMHLITALGMVSTTLLSVYLISHDELSRGLLPVTIILSIYLFSPVSEVVGTLRNMGGILAAGDRIFRILDAAPDVLDRELSETPRIVSHAVHFDKVSFSYSLVSLTPALDAVTFQVEPGQTVALVGESGAGKSTCLQLLLRFWDVTGGAILIGGVDIRDLPQEQLRELVTIVPQDIYLFHTSIRENIRLGRQDASDEEVEAAAKTANCHEFILQLTNGYETNAGERAIQLSGGQRQRIALARAFLKNAPILVMDEATSNLDVQNEQLVQKATEQVRYGKTTIIIAHRLSTIRSADKIVVLEQGKIVQMGSHEELVSQEGRYRYLFAAQFT